MPSIVLTPRMPAPLLDDSARFVQRHHRASSTLRQLIPTATYHTTPNSVALSGGKSSLRNQGPGDDPAFLLFGGVIIALRSDGRTCRAQVKLLTYAIPSERRRQDP